MSEAQSDLVTALFLRVTTMSRPSGHAHDPSQHSLLRRRTVRGGGHDDARRRRRRTCRTGAGRTRFDLGSGRPGYRSAVARRLGRGDRARRRGQLRCLDQRARRHVRRLGGAGHVLRELRCHQQRRGDHHVRRCSPLPGRHHARDCHLRRLGRRRRRGRDARLHHGDGAHIRRVSAERCLRPRQSGRRFRPGVRDVGWWRRAHDRRPSARLVLRERFPRRVCAVHGNDAVVSRGRGVGGGATQRHQRCSGRAPAHRR